ncbi:hypothetical protein [Actinomadura sp. 3N508]|uniref:hypothetical protein n=1 Tax=Actinomadura sp. 3N508 TaxID=3375153 RepID=UPI0037A9194C
MSPPVGGYIALWDENDVGFWRLSGSPPSMMAEGAMIRLDDEAGRYRELGLLDRETDLLVLRDREPGPGGTPVVQLMPLTPVTMDEARTESTRGGVTAAEWLGDAAGAAASRGESLTVHPGGWQGPFLPSVGIEALQNSDGAWLSAVRATPVPIGAEYWSDHPAAPEAEYQQLEAPASYEAIRLGGALALTAFIEWGIHPLMLGMTFAPNSYGSWS